MNMVVRYLVNGDRGRGWWKQLGDRARSSPNLMIFRIKYGNYMCLPISEI